MLAPDLAKWNQSTDDLFTYAVQAEHSRTRERFMALHHLATVGQGATVYARRIGRGVLGLVGMRERAAFVGGTLTVRSGPRAGTEIEVRIPLPPDTKVAAA